MVGPRAWLWLALLMVTKCETTDQSTPENNPTSVTCEASAGGTTTNGSCTQRTSESNLTVAEGEEAGNETKRNRSFVPEVDRRGVPIDRRIDGMFLGAIEKVAGKVPPGIRYSSIPSWHYAMLNDVQRNSNYRRALTKAIAKQKAKGLDARVLDIGTGSGLLSLLALKAGADHVSTCEVNVDLIEVAKENVKRNCNRTDCPIKILPKRSTDIEVGPGLDMEKKANILVSEIVDSMLLRESIIPTVAHATQFLVEPDAIIIPKSGKLEFMLIESKDLRDTHYLDSDISGLDLSYINEGSHDLTAQEYVPNFLYRAMSDSATGLSFDFARVRTTDNPYEFYAFNLTVTSDGVLDGLVMWLEMSLDDELTLSCDPRLGKLHFPHWQHVVFMPKYPVRVQVGDKVTILAGHGEVSVRAKMIQINGQPFWTYPPYKILEGAHPPLQGPLPTPEPEPAAAAAATTP